MVFAEIFVALVFLLLAALIIRVAAKRWRRAGVVGVMRQQQEQSEVAGQVRRFQSNHKNPEADKKAVEGFTQGR